YKRAFHFLRIELRLARTFTRDRNRYRMKLGVRLHSAHSALNTLLHRTEKTPERFRRLGKFQQRIDQVCQLVDRSADFSVQLLTLSTIEIVIRQELCIGHDRAQGVAQVM